MIRLLASFLSLLMLAGSFVPQNDLSELAKLPDLVQHYRYHHSVAGGGLSVGEFLIEHYGTGEKQHFGCTFSPWHRQDHQNLPLHNLRDSSWVGFVLAPSVQLRLARPHRAHLAVFRRLADSQYQFGLGEGPLQPPRA